MQTFIYGAGINGQVIFDLISQHYSNKIVISGYIDQVKTGMFNGLEIFSLTELPRNSRVIISISNFDEAVKICSQLKKEHITDIWWFSSRKKAFGNDFFTEQCVDCKEWIGTIMKQVEMHIMDSCNLNCRGCTHFSPILSKSPPSLEQCISDVIKIKKKINHIVFFYLLGGEPFLNPRIKSYIREIRKIISNTQLLIVTNGLLIPSLDKEILNTIKDADVRMIISEYPPTIKIIDKICKKLDDFGIIYDVRPINEKFNKPLSLSNESRYPSLCISDGCVAIGNNKIARCPTLLYIDAFNDYFGTNMPNDGILCLDDQYSGESLIKKMKERVPLCDYCVKNEIEWHPCDNKIVLDDFAVFD